MASPHPSTTMTTTRYAGLLMALLLNACSTTAVDHSNAPNAVAGSASNSSAATAAALPTSMTAVFSPSTSMQSGQTSTSGSGTSTPTPPPFDQVIKGAQRQDGLLPLWKRQDKVWLELRPGDFGKPLFLSPKLASGIGEAGVFGGLMQSRWAQVGRPQWIEFRKVQQQVQLLAINAAYTAQTGSPQERAVRAAFSPSLLASVPLASTAQTKSGAVLIDANALLLGDLLGVAQHLQRTYRQGYALDTRNSALIQSRTQTRNVVFEVSQHFAAPGLSAAVPPPGTPNPTVPQSVPDPRSLFITVHYSLSALPDKPMATRLADPRVGYFTTTVADFTNDLARTPRVRYINRWRLEKKDPSAALSEPVHPIVFWLDPSLPEEYRPAVTEGILEWNKAFEAIGFKNAIEVKTPPSGKPFDTLETGHTSIRWMTNSQPGFGAIGPTHVDPRTGEILDADVALESLSSRAIRTVRSQYFTGGGLLDSTRSNTSMSSAFDGSSNKTIISPDADETIDQDHCQHDALAAEQLGLALDVLEAQGLLDPDSPRVKEFVLAYLKDTTMHEVGHTLGLRHNFKASRWHTAQQLTDPELTRTQGNNASVMDYAPINLPMPGQRAGAPFQTTLGPYDYWAIEYGYKPLPDDATAATQELQAIAERSADPAQTDALAFGTDEDNALGLDPQALVFDLGQDPVAFARTRLAIVRDLFDRQAERQLTASDDPTLLRRSVSYGLREMGRTAQVLLRQIGGVVTRRDAPGSGRDLLDPLPPDQQRAALDMLMHDFLSPQAVALSPALQRHLAPDYFDRQEGAPVPTDFSVADVQLGLQREIVATLMSEPLAERMLDNVDKTRDRDKRPLTMEELHRTLTETIWSSKPLPPGTDSAQRNLQREHVNRLALNVVRGGSNRADVRAFMRQQASALLKQLQAQRGGDTLAQAHREDCIDTLKAALQASVIRPGP